jgi:hypothetical protein
MSKPELKKYLNVNKKDKLVKLFTSLEGDRTDVKRK